MDLLSDYNFNMSSETKSLLKEARNSYKEKNYAEAMQKCKAALKKDKSNYTALVLLGAAMGEIEEFKAQAPLAFQKATIIQPESMPAWQGLAAFYEKELQEENNSNLSELILTYCQLLKLNSNLDKFTFFLTKISNFCLSLHEEKVVSEIIIKLLSLVEHLNSDQAKSIKKLIIQILANHPNLINKFINIWEDILMSLINSDDTIDLTNYYEIYFTSLCDSSNLSKALETAMTLIRKYPDDISLLEWICLFYYKSKVLNIHCKNIDINTLCETLLKLKENSESGWIAKSIFLKETKEFVKARTCLNRAAVIKPTSFYAWFLLAEINTRLYCWDDAGNAAEHALKMVNDEFNSQFKQRLLLILIESLSRSLKKQNLKTAITMCEKMMLNEDTPIQIQLHYTRASIYLEKSNISDKLEWLKTQNETKIQALILHAKYLTKNNHYEEAVDVLDSTLEHSEAWLILGKIYWEIMDYNHSLMAFLNGVKTDRYNWECLVYLGQYYRDHGKDMERSRKCYQTALQINPNSEEAGVGLSTVYRVLKNTEANIQLLKRFTVQNNGPKWAWLQLGLQSLEHGDVISAIKSLQTVIRSDPNDNYSWESLGDAYWARGAYTSALRSYERALELNPSSLYPMIQLANIKLIIGKFDEAKMDFEQILHQKPCFVTALKGLAETCLNLAKQNLDKKLFGRARDNLQEAIDNLTVLIREQNNISCIWKLLGDSCYIMASLPDKYCRLLVSPMLTKSNNTEEYDYINRKDILSLSLRCYCRALSLSKDSALLWHDLACCYFIQLQYNTSDCRSDTIKKCIAAAKHAILLSPSSWLHWNLLGVICMSSEVKNFALAQHCFVMAVDIESYNAIAWSNLGTLYLYLDDLYKANEAFSRAQRADPSYVNSWIGQGIIAEKLKSQEAMDLFRHSTQLDYHDCAAIGYAHWVLQTILDPNAKDDPLFKFSIKDLHAIPLASDALNWYIEKNPNDEYALNAHGLLLERQKLYKSAAQQFTSMLNLCKDEHKDAARINLSRILIVLGKYTEAIKLCKGIKNKSFTSQCHLALALFKAECYEDSYNAYEVALHHLTDDKSDKANILCAMAVMAYVFQGPEDTKTLLFQCIQIAPPTIEGFLAAAALGILHEDYKLTMLVLKELRQYQNKTEYRHHIISLSAYFYLVQGRITDASRIISKAIHAYPDDAECWVSLIKVLLKTKSTALQVCTEKVLFFRRNTLMSNVIDVSVCSFSLCILNERFVKEGIILTQKIVFSFPSKAESWISLVVALYQSYAHMRAKCDVKLLEKIMQFVKNMYHHNDRMILWLQKTEENLTNLKTRISNIY
ncbi:superkiller complex protein 3 [Prorops nasuta]|uniref:superkiller complex protein 3 n=1 Tax=Prorops nasuta TaxID=863751 RepID=UPI0034CE1ADD